MSPYWRCPHFPRHSLITYTLCPPEVTSVAVSPLHPKLFASVSSPWNGDFLCHKIRLKEPSSRSILVPGKQLEKFDEYISTPWKLLLYGSRSFLRGKMGSLRPALRILRTLKTFLKTQVFHLSSSSVLHGGSSLIYSRWKETIRCVLTICQELYLCRK